MSRLIIWGIISAAMLLSCNGKNSNLSNDTTIEEVEFVAPVDDKTHDEAPSMFDERYGTPIEGKEGKPTDDLVKEPKDDEIVGFDDGADISYDNVGEYSDY